MKKTSRVVLTAILVVAMVASLAVSALAGFDFKLKDGYTVKDVVITSDKNTVVNLSDEVHNWTVNKAKIYAKITAKTLYDNGQNYEPTYDEGTCGNVYFGVKGPAVFLYPQEIGSIKRGTEAKYCVVAIDVKDGTNVAWDLFSGTKAALSGCVIVKNGHAELTLSAADTANLPAGGNYNLEITMVGEPDDWKSGVEDIKVENPTTAYPGDTTDNNDDDDNDDADSTPTMYPSEDYHHTLKVDVTTVGTVVADTDGTTHAVAVTAPDGHAALGYNYNDEADRSTISFSVLGGTVNVSWGDHFWQKTYVTVNQGNTVTASSPSHFDHVRVTAGGVNFIHLIYDLFD